MAGEDSKRPWLDFLKDMFIDGYKLIGASAPVLSIGFTIAKALDLHIGLENISYAWGLLPLLLWVLIAYWRRWLVSRELSVEQRGQADRVVGWMEAADLDLKAPLILQNSSDQRKHLAKAARGSFSLNQRSGAFRPTNRHPSMDSDERGRRTSEKLVECAELSCQSLVLIGFDLVVENPLRGRIGTKRGYHLLSFASRIALGRRNLGALNSAVRRPVGA
jgi:hypothetical protein